ncbi:MAG: YhbY family RNA-binding protein [Clostridia bacterium]|nr:YhbY family RNA-binding protein [Clostridia bacterium]
MLTSKERAAKRAAANRMPVIMQVGKNGIEENSVIQVDDALTARELIKLRVLDTSEDSPREVANELAARTGADVVQVVGGVIVLWRENPELHK